MKLNVILAVDEKYGYSLNNKIPWNEPDDMKWFKQKTLKSILIMGKTTWESIPNKNKFVNDRICFILTRSHIQQYDTFSFGNFYYMNSYDDIINTCCRNFDNCSIFAIGGKYIFSRSFDDIHLNHIYVTRIHGDYNCDRRIQELHDILSYRCKLECKTEYTRLCIEEYKVILEENVYLDLLKNIINSGISREDRTGIGTISKFGTHLSFSLENNQLPLITTKKTFWKGILHELLWFLSGDTNANNLKSKGIHIWDGNSSREFLDKKGFCMREIGDLGPVYGFQWRHWGSYYEDMNCDYTDLGIDQVKRIIQLIKQDPNSRRIILTAWNVSDLQKMCLPPCHMMCQFYVECDKLSCQMYQRSADMFLGVPFNIASYATLTHIIAHLTGMKAHKLHITFGDSHVYKTHIEAVNTQLIRHPKQFPKLKINDNANDIDKLKYEDFELINYQYDHIISAPMAV